MISPDGTQIVYQSATSFRQLNLRPINQLDVAPLRSVADGFSPFFSPDSAWIGFAAPVSGTTADGLILRKVSIFGGAPLTLTETEAPSFIRGASWGTDDQIIFGTIGGGLFRVSGGGAGSLRH